MFCVPGESYLPVLDALYQEQSIDLISARHEGAASFMAEGYAKASGKPGVVMATRGVGASNLAIGVHTAYQDSTPMLVLLGQVHSYFRGREGFQEIDLAQFLRRSQSGRLKFMKQDVCQSLSKGRCELHKQADLVRWSFRFLRMC